MFFWFDALLCFQFPSLARWTVLIWGTGGGKYYEIKSVRFRWERSARSWIRRYGRTTSPLGLELHYRTQRLPVPVIKEYW